MDIIRPLIESNIETVVQISERPLSRFTDSIQQNRIAGRLLLHLISESGIKIPRCHQTILTGYLEIHLQIRNRRIAISDSLKIQQLAAFRNILNFFKFEITRQNQCRIRQKKRRNRARNQKTESKKLQKAPNAKMFANLLPVRSL